MSLRDFKEIKLLKKNILPGTDKALSYVRLGLVLSFISLKLLDAQGAN